jgi:hypothetical protein
VPSDWLENLLGCDVDSARRILPQFQERLAVGADVVRMCRYAPHNPVARFDPGRALVLGDVRHSVADLAAGRARSTRAFVVEPAGVGSCRLVVRWRELGEGADPGPCAVRHAAQIDARDQGARRGNLGLVDGGGWSRSCGFCPRPCSPRGRP